MKPSIILPLLVLVSGCAKPASELIADARTAYAGHDYQAAKLHVAEALDRVPGDQEMLVLQARTLLALGDGSGAGAVLERLPNGALPGGTLAELSAEAALLRKSPETALKLLASLQSPEAERLRALAAIQTEDLPAAGEHFRKAVELGGNARAFADYGRYQLILGDAAGALASAEQAHRLAADGLDTLLLLGQLAVLQGDLRTALANYERASHLYPSSLAALTGQAAVLGDLGRIPEMMAVVDKAGAMAPRDRTVTFLKARALVARKDWRGVRSLVDSYKGDMAASDPLHVLYGEALLRLDLHEQAIAQLGPLVRLQPGNRSARLLLAEAQLAAGAPRDAAATIRPLADAPTARHEELALMVKAAKAIADPGLAGYEARLRSPAVQALGKDLAEADQALRRGNWAGAAQAYEKVLAVTDGRNVMVLNNMAYAQVMLGNYEQAKGFAQRALEQAPDNASVLDTAGWALLKSGSDPREAKRLLRLAAEKAPQNPTIRAHLTEADRAGG